MNRKKYTFQRIILMFHVIATIILVSCSSSFTLKTPTYEQLYPINTIEVAKPADSSQVFQGSGRISPTIQSANSIKCKDMVSPTNSNTISPKPDYKIPVGNQVGGISKALAFQPQTIYLGVGPRLLVIDIKNPEMPKLAGQSEILGLDIVNFIEIENSYLYVTLRDGRFLALSLIDPDNPRILDSLDLVTSPQWLSVNNGYAFIASGKYGIAVIDVANPTALRQVGWITTACEAIALSVVDGYLYITERNASDDSSLSGVLQVFDITTPTNAQHVGIYKLAHFAQAIMVTSKYAYLAGDGLAIINVSDPFNLYEIGYYRGMGSFYNDIAVLDQYAIITENQYCDVVSVCPSQAEIIDLTDPFQPKLFVDTKDDKMISGSSAGRAVVVSDGLIYLANETGLKILNGISLDLISEYRSIGIVADIAITETYAYSVDAYRTLNIIDVSETPSLHPITYLDNCEICDLLDVSGAYGFVNMWDYGIAIVDLHFIQEPEFIFKPEDRVKYNAITISDHYLYAVQEDNLEVNEAYIKIFDISNHNTIKEISAVTLQAHGTYKIIVVENTVYIGSEGRLDIIDVSNPKMPFKLSEFTVEQGIEKSDNWWSFTVNDGYGYIVRKEKKGLGITEAYVIDLVDKGLPKQISRVFLSYGGNDLVIVNSYAYSIGDNGLSVVDISNPIQPHEEEDYEIGGSKIVAKGNYLYIASWDKGLWLLPVKPVSSEYQ